jgi:fibronectin-binding autotransporter adhesin
MKASTCCRTFALFCFANGLVRGDAPTAILFAGPDAGNQSACLPYTHTVNRPLPFRVFPAGQAGGVRLATGDVNGDGRPDIIAGSGPGGSRQVVIYDGVSHQSLGTIPLTGVAYDAGVWVAAGDVNGDGRADIVTGAGGGPKVRVFSGSGLGELMAFDAYATTFSGGVRVAAGDVNGDGKADIITGAGPGGGPQVKVFNAAGLGELTSFFAYDTSYTGGVFVSAGKLDPDNKADFVVSPGPNSAALPLKIYSGATLAETATVQLPASTVNTFTAVGGAASTAPQYVNFAREGKLQTFDSTTKAIIKSLYGDVFRNGTIATGDVTNDGKPDIVAGSDTLPLVQVLTPDFAARWLNKFPLGAAFHGGFSVASGDLNGDGTYDMVMGAGTGGGGDLKTCDGTTGKIINSFLPFTPAAFPIFVAAGDVNGDGKDDIIVAPGEGGAPNVKVFSSPNVSLVNSFFAYGPAFTGGVRLASADVNGDGLADIVTGTGPGVAAEVKVFSGKDLTVLRDFQPFTATFTGGVFVAAGDVNGDGRADIVTGAGSGGPSVKVFDGVSGAAIGAFFAYDAGFTGGVRVAVGDVDGDSVPEIICSPGPGSPPEVRCFSFPGLQRVFTFQPYPASFTGGVFISSWTPAAAKVIETFGGADRQGRIQLTLQAPLGRTLYFDSSSNLIDWNPVSNRPASALPTTFFSDLPPGGHYYFRGRVQ